MMTEIFQLLEKLVSLTAPAIVLVQQLLCTTLTPARENPYWRFYEGDASCAVTGTVDYREPTDRASTTQPFLAVKLRNAGVTIKDFRARYGEPSVTDVSAHHPTFIGYTFMVKGRPVSVNADSQTGAIILFSIDYSTAVAPDSLSR